MSVVTTAVILSGGYGTRLMEETEARPKPMVEIGGRPILWHIMKIYEQNGITDFVIPLGYKGALIKQFFSEYHLHSADISVDLVSGSVTTLKRTAEPWRVTLIDTGLDTMTGGRLRRVREYLGEKPFCMTYGDGVAKLDIQEIINFHLQHGRAATVTSVRPPARFGALEMDGARVLKFREKPKDELYVNGGFFVMSPKVFDYVDSDHTIFEREPMERLAIDNELMAYQHTGFWHSMDTMRDRKYLEDLWATREAPWKVW